jgi:outer membrane PBP1 activator LpoA protein
MALPFQLRCALFAFVLLLHGMELCVAADNEASAGAPADAVQPALALLLPLASPDFARAAEAVRQGFMAALKHSGEKLAVGTFSTDASGESILAGYEQAVKLGARLVVGPMTRSGVSALAAGALVSVPTLGLNLPEGGTALPPRLYTFGLALEAEAQFVARSAAAENLKSAILVSAKDALAQRSRAAFAETWARLGGVITESYAFDAQTDLSALRQALANSEADLIFLAADTRQARTVRPFLNHHIAVFATSQVNSGGNDALANGDLNGIRFVDMPWLVQPDHPAVMIYPRPPGIADELERFYALGIDAFRIAAALLQGSRTLSLDGVTGRITLYSNQLTREPVQAVFRNGVGVTPEHGAPGEGTR